MNQTAYLKWRSVPYNVVKLAQRYRPIFEKMAEGELTTSDAAEGMRTMFNTMRLGKGQDVFGLPSEPNPVVSMLLGGLAGGGLGYAGSSLVSRFLPPDWKKDRLKRTSSIVGALAGAAPGAALAGINMTAGLAPWSDEMFKVSYSKIIEDLDVHVDDRLKDAYYKAAAFGSGLGPIGVPVDDFNRVVWGDRRVSDLLQLPEKAAITGLVSGASQMPGKRNSSLVTPYDIGMMAAGMGSGYVSGALVGKGLSALMGAPPSVQDDLKNKGVWAGAIKAMLPLIF